MLRVTQQSNSAAAKSYYSQSDYLSEGQELVGSWGGEGAKRLGLDGVVDKESFDRLCDNIDPQTGRSLTVRTRDDRTVGYDLTFSVPKSVSLLYSLTGDREVLTAFREAVDETMRDIEPEMATRVRRGGKDVDRETGNMIWAEFVHTTSRPVGGIPDPQLHAHCFAFNATWDDEESRWKAGKFKDIKASAPCHQAAFRVRLAGKLQDLGFNIRRTRDDFELEGVGTATLKRFSRRTAEIEAKAEELGITDPHRKGELGATTREKKSKTLSWTELQKAWDARLTPAERESLASVHRREAKSARPSGGERLSVDHALGHVFARSSVATEKELLTEALKRGIGYVTVDGVREELGRRPLIRRVIEGRAVVTTEAVLAEERAIVDFAKKGRGRCRPLGDPNRPFVRDWLNAGQKAAVRHVFDSRDRVSVILGKAGTGKTTILQEIRDGLMEAGKNCVALAPSAAASRGVLREEANFATADTVARFLKDTAMQREAKGGVILLDEAGLLGCQDTLALFRVAEEIQARIIIIGDLLQHRSVSRGQPLKLLEKEAGLPVVTVSEILRQTVSGYKQAAKELSDGRTAEGLAVLDKLGWVKELPDNERYQALAEAYLSAVRETKRGGGHKTALVVTATHAESALIADSIRSGLKESGALGEEREVGTWIPAHLTEPEKADAANYAPGDLLVFHQNAPGILNGSRRVLREGEALPPAHPDRYELYRPASMRIAVGDRIRVTAKCKAKDGKRLDNGALHTVRAFTPRGEIVLDNGRVVPTHGGTHLSQGYAITTQAAQGRTVDKVFAGISAQSFPATTKRTAYVAATRGKEQAMFFTSDKKELLRAMQRADEPMTATALARSRLKPTLTRRLRKQLAFGRRLATFAQTHEPRRPTEVRRPQRETGHDR
ncbi:MobF family relaxase [Zavarzinella formosa]|uniref:MobF family relaxase n=1 Tax=Zavarzinella formosa TaxID=360055 RepID=UPI0002D3364D|nr:MobF family relaxase [Zavarzinella formosa]